jgi:hypothetical protein
LRDDHRLLRRCRWGDGREQDRGGTKKDVRVACMALIS